MKSFADSEIEIERRILFDDMSLNVITKLEGHSSVASIEFMSNDGVTPRTIDEWNETNSPFNLPDDVASFYSSLDGINLTWNVLIGLKSVTIGEIILNQLNQIKSIPLIKPLMEGTFLAAYILNSNDDIGDIFLVYLADPRSGPRSGDNLELNSSAIKTEIWFRDLELDWHYICPSFTHLLRIMVTHLGNINMKI